MVELVLPQPTDLLDGLRTADSPMQERAARRALRRQVARLERQLSDVVASGFPGVHIRHDVPGSSGPRLLSFSELEALRDGLADRVRTARAQLAAVADRQERSRLRLEAMLADPAAHRFEQVTRADLGMPGCGAYQARPRMGIVGMFLGWWQIKLSSGCPLGIRPDRPSG